MRWARRCSTRYSGRSDDTDPALAHCSQPAMAYISLALGTSQISTISAISAPACLAFPAPLPPTPVLSCFPAATCIPDRRAREDLTSPKPEIFRKPARCSPGLRTAIRDDVGALVQNVSIAYSGLASALIPCGACQYRITRGTGLRHPRQQVAPVRGQASCRPAVRSGLLPASHLNSGRATICCAQ